VTAVEVRAVRGGRERRAYVRVAEPINAGNPAWVAPLRRTTARAMSQRHNPFHREADIEHFVALGRGPNRRALGRVAAVIHPAHMDRHGDRAFFGFFESVRDDEVAAALLGAVEEWAAERGVFRVAGPYSYTATQEIGLLTDGFGQVSALMQPHNPDYYQDLLKACGYERAFDMTCYTWRAGDHPDIEDRLLADGEEVLRRNGLNVRSIRMDRYEQELENLRWIYNRSFAEHPQLAPISRPVFAAQAAELRAIIDPRLALIVERAGCPVAFALLVPDLNQVLKSAGGRISAQLALRLAVRRDRRIRGVDAAVVVMIGALPEFSGAGFGRVLAAQIVQIARGGRYRVIHTTWIHEDNRWSLALARKLRNEPSRRYSVYERSTS
jgi:GNAT superfamily N-acetyltransferase